MNCEGSGSDHSLQEVFPWHLTKKTEENHEKVKIPGVLTYISTRQILHTSLQHYHYSICITKLLSKLFHWFTTYEITQHQKILSLTFEKPFDTKWGIWY